MTPSSILTGAAKARYVFPQEKFMFVAFTTSHSFVRFVYAIFSQEGERLDAALKECKAEVDMTDHCIGYCVKRFMADIHATAGKRTVNTQSPFKRVVLDADRELDIF
ncbi:hypothetical protein Q1695_003864 [Nippostrongylus brasiliensis]|nr:hypothetical protein Q1695_003864 [Nippostrongylus brasiliensis]